MKFIVHFASKEQVAGLEKIFTAPERVVFNWPCANGETIVESMEWKTPEWLKVMMKTVGDK